MCKGKAIHEFGLRGDSFQTLSYIEVKNPYYATAAPMKLVKICHAKFLDKKVTEFYEKKMKKLRKEEGKLEKKKEKLLKRIQEKEENKEKW